MNRVILLERPKGNIDTRGAEAFGEVVMLFPPTRHRASIFQSTRFVDDVLARLAEVQFDAGRDLVVVAGNTISLVLMSVAIIDRYKQLRLLAYSASECKYVELPTLKSTGDKHDGQEDQDRGDGSARTPGAVRAAG